jgi:hypothetical protein
MTRMAALIFVLAIPSASFPDTLTPIQAGNTWTYALSDWGFQTPTFNRSGTQKDSILTVNKKADSTYFDVQVTQTSQFEVVGSIFHYQAVASWVATGGVFIFLKENIIARTDTTGQSRLHPQFGDKHGIFSHGDSINGASFKCVFETDTILMKKWVKPINMLQADSGYTLQNYGMISERWVWYGGITRGGSEFHLLEFNNHKIDPNKIELIEPVSLLPKIKNRLASETHSTASGRFYLVNGQSLVPSHRESKRQARVPLATFR